jgi:hypothetical protein
MLALAIEFSRCSRARTLKAEQRVPVDEVSEGGADGLPVIDLESSGSATDDRLPSIPECQMAP